MTFLNANSVVNIISIVNSKPYTKNNKTKPVNIAQVLSHYELVY